jgi:hypothetical protein
MVDLASEEPLWSKSAMAARSSSEGSGNPLAMAIVALVSQVITSGGDHSHDLAPTANARLLDDPHDRMLLGPRHAGFAEEQAKRRAIAAGEAAPPPK